MNSEMLLPQPSVPAVGAVLNPFVIVNDAAGFVDFVSDVFGVEESAEARTAMPDGKLIHAQLRLGNVDLMIADRLDGWPLRPGLLQVWVRDVAAVLRRAGARGATTSLGRRFGRHLRHAGQGTEVVGARKLSVEAFHLPAAEATA